MGMFDTVRCLYDVGHGDLSAVEFQTKDTDAQYLDLYEVRADGTLWHEEYDRRFEEDANAFFGFWIHRENQRWVHVPMTGEVEIYGGDFNIKFWFVDGRVKDVVVAE